MFKGKAQIKKYSSIALKGLGSLFSFTLLITLPWRWIDPPVTSFIMHAKFELPEDGSKKIKQEWTAWGDISPYMPIAVVAEEDQNFPHHFGFDFKSISKVISTNNRRLRGASTITQQVAKNLFLWQGKSFIRKGIEAYLTIFIETFWPKQRILEVYLNIAEFGKGVYGVGSASKLFFKKSAKKLTLFEASLLAAVLPSPRKRSPATPSAYVVRRAEWVMRQVKQLGGIEYLKDM